MQISIHLDATERDTAIGFARAFVDGRISRLNGLENLTEEDIRREQDYLAEVASHIQVYLRYNRI